MKNKNVILLIVIFIVILLFIYFFVDFKKDTSIKNVNESIMNSSDKNTISNEETQNTEKSSESNETLLSTFSTEIKDKSPGRLENIRITCGIINNTIINPNETFSFNNIVGQPSSARGYKEATIIIDGEHETGIGGGNCQVSSTLYNSVLAIPSLTVVERHEHGGSGVTYVPEGKDAAVSFGSLDLKFRNDNNYKIKIVALTDDKNITTSILKLEN